VICTHLHVDHVGWNTKLEDGAWVPTFPNARYLFGKTEFAHWSTEGDEEQQTILSDSVQPILDAGLAEFVEMDHRISPHLRLTPSTGHTPGHVSVMIEPNGESAVITGDMSHHPCQMAHLVAALRQRSESGGSDARATVRRMGRQTHSGDRHSLLGADGGIHNAGGRRVPLRRRGDGRLRCLTSGEDDNLEKEHRIELNG